MKAKSVRRLKPQGDSTWLRIVLTEGKNREIRRMLAKLGHKVMRLKRVAIGPVKLDKLPKGKARRVSEAEVAGPAQVRRRRRQEKIASRPREGERRAADQRRHEEQKASGSKPKTESAVC